jgi:N6-adenosine-specific RNA methylase IME4
MKPEDAEEYTQALGQVVAGGWRQIALGDRLGVPKALKLTTEQWVKQRLGGYVKLSLKERAPVVEELKAQDVSNRKIAAIVGVDESVIRDDLKRAGNPASNERAAGGSDDPPAGIPASGEPLDVLTGLAATEDVRQRIETKAATEQRRADRLEHLGEIAKGNVALGVEARYPVIYGDPPWRYEHVKTESRAIENQYPTMALDEIAALPVNACATEDAVLFLWATSPKLAEAMGVIASWGFSYRTSAVWDKGQIGMGYYFRQQHELLLVAVKGSPPTPQPDARPSSVFRAPRGDHSLKPVALYEAIERMYPTLPKLELFARSTREGWAAWGNQTT